MADTRRVTIKELHERTGEVVRRAGRSNVPVQITDRGKPIALLGGPSTLKAKRPRKRKLLSEYEELLKKPDKRSVLEDLDAIRR